MPRFIGKNVDNTSKLIDSKLAESLSSQRSGNWYEEDWYSKTFKTKASDSKEFDLKNLDAYKISNKGRNVRCLDLTDSTMSNSPLKRFHQVTICGNSVVPAANKSDDNFIGGYTNGKDYVITAQLPSSFSYNIGGNWSTPFKSVLDFSGLNGLTSTLTSGQNSALFGLATMSVWESPNPLQIQLTLQCIDDIGDGTGQNTLEAIDILSRWALPYTVNKWGMYSGLPGPSVPAISLTYNEYGTNEKGETIVTGTNKKSLVVGNLKNSTRLSVLVGGMLFMDNCILTDINVNYPNTKAQYLHDYSRATFTRGSTTADAGIRLLPVRCDITLTFKTVMGLTQTNFTNMLALRENFNISDMNNIGINELQDLGDPSTMKHATSVIEGVSKVATSIEKAAKIG